MTKKIKIKYIVVCCLLLSCIGLAGTLAYFQSKTNPVTNTFTVGSVDTEIDEDVNINGDVIEKTPKVKNTGKNAALVRVKLTISPEGAINIGEGKNLEINEQWIDGDDGYYYYNGILPARSEGATEFPTTGTLFDKITGVIDVNGKFVSGIEPFEISISQESIQIFAIDKATGEKVGFDSETDVYNQDKAKMVWNIYDGKSNQ